MVSSPIRAPLRSISALVASVVPWISARTAVVAAPASCSRVTTPSSTACDGSFGVVRSLPTRTAPVVSSTQTRSVKVPPMSTPIREGWELVVMSLTSCGGSLRGKVYTETGRPYRLSCSSMRASWRIETLEDGDLLARRGAIAAREVRARQPEVGDRVHRR